jgi:hypothetical protein
MPELGLRLKVRGHVTSYYDKATKSYMLGRCDRLGTLYPFVTLELAEGSPNVLALGELATQRQALGFDNVKLETVPAEDKLAKFSGGISKIVADDNREVKGRAVFYYFSFNGKTYKASLYVPYGPDDNRLIFQSERVITVETAKEMDVRVLELLANLERM